MPVLLDSDDPEPGHDLFGVVSTTPVAAKPRPRQQAVFCGKCNRLDSIFLGGGVSLSSQRCPRCRGELITDRDRSVKLKFYDAIMGRCQSLVVMAAMGQGDIDIAADYARYAAHTAFKLQLVPYGPEPKR